MTELLEKRRELTVSAGEDDVRQFLREIREFPRLTLEEERELARRCTEGDEDAIDHLLSLLPDRSGVSVCCYDGNIPKLLSLLSDATYIIASRFHAMILALSFGKPVFPISYNCKSRHYLEDLDFRGKFASLSDLPETTVEDVLYNYDHRIITDCSLHKQHAQNQFRALREFLDK